jgi:MFS-type transporter involved in bile tolerance (Atg22 family)
MTPATMRRDSSEGGRHAEGRGYGMVVFAPILLFVISFFNMLYGIAAIANSHVFVANAHYVVGDLRAWGWVTLIIAAVQFIAACGVLMGNQLARWFAVPVVGINAIEIMFFIPAYPVLGAGHHRRRRSRAVGAVRS